jgi:hypothetical protein
MKQRFRSFFKKHPTANLIGLSVLFVLIEALYSFCSVDKTPEEDSKLCPAFSDANFDAWFPYSHNQKLFFTSSLGAKDTLTIGTVEKSPDTYTAVSLSCSSNASVRSVDLNSSSSNGFTINYLKFDNEPRNHLNLFLYDFLLADAWLKETDIVPAPTLKHQFLVNATINGKAFANVIEVMRDTAVKKDAGVYKIWLSKQTGLVGYERYPALERFVIQ